MYAQKKKYMNEVYELMFIVPGSLDESQVPAVKERAMGLVTAAGGSIVADHDLGRRRLQYQVKRQTSGHYYLVYFNIERSQMAELDKQLRLDPDVLRYLLVKGIQRTEEELTKMLADHHPGQAQPIVEEPVKATEGGVEEDAKRAKERAAEKPIEKPVEKPAEESAAEAKGDLAPGETKAEEVTEEKEAADPKSVSVEDLDKKLDAILDDTDIETKL